MEAAGDEFAPGVRIVFDGGGTTRYDGRAAALIDSGLVKREWLPGEIGNGKGAQCLVYFADGTVKLLPRNSRMRSHETGFGGLRIVKSGGLFHVFRYWSDAELEEWESAREKKKGEELWRLARQAHAQPEIFDRWKNGVLYHIEQAEKLIDGRLVFSGLPAMELHPEDIEAAMYVIDDLRNVLSQACPKIQYAVNQGNVVSLNALAFRSMGCG